MFPNIALLILSLLTSCFSLRVSDVQVPEMAVSGSSVTLTCNYEQRKDRPDPVYSVKWYKGVDQFYEYIQKNKPPLRVYPLPYLGVDESRSNMTSVVLTGLTKESSGTYRCEVMGDKPHFETDDDDKNMTVLDVPQWGPHIQGLIPGSRIHPGEIILARCLMGMSDPLVDITWLSNHQEVTSFARLTPLLQTSLSKGRIQASEIEFITTEDSFRRGALTLTCEARLFNVFHKSAEVTLLHALQPQPAEFGWFSRGTSKKESNIMAFAVTILLVYI